MNKKQVAAIYVRVSTEEQVHEGYSVTSQTEVLIQYCQMLGIKIYKIYQDLSILGKDDKDRPGIQQLQRDAHSKYFNTVLVWKISLLSHSLKDLLMIINDFFGCGVSLISYSEKFDTRTATGLMTLRILASITESERDCIVENVKLGLREAAKQGRRTGGALLGYQTVAGNLKIIEEEAKLVRLIYNLYLNQKMGFSKIAKHLNKLNYCTKRGNAFGKDAIGLILSNPTYIGINRFKAQKKGEYYEVPGNHQPIIDKKIWEQVQKRRKNRATHNALRHERSCFLLSSLIKCPFCGAAMISAYSVSTKKLEDGSNKRYRYRYYKCSGFDRKQSGCKANYISADRLENDVLIYIKKTLDNPEIIIQMMDKIVSTSTEEIKPLITERQVLVKQIEEAKTIRERYYRLFEAGKLTDTETLIQRLNELEKKLHVHKTKIKQLSKEIEEADIVPISRERVLFSIQKYFNILERGEDIERKKFFQMFIKEVFLTKEKPATVAGIELNLPLKPLV